MNFIIGLVIGLIVGGGGMYVFHAKVKKALEQAKSELEEKLDKLKKD